jgi:3-deoxy-D-manno-octulosonic-acid transferase
MSLLYTLALRLYALLIRVAARWNPKARQFVAGRRDLLPRIAAQLAGNTAPVAWFHAASLGEFEQARPVIEGFRVRHPHFKIVLTFFSPSGYEVRKNYPGADHVFYLPEDSARHARAFVAAVRPAVAFFAKYEFWHYYLRELNHQNVPAVSFSAIFRPGQLFFRPYGGFFRRILGRFAHLYVQNEASAQLLRGVGITRVTVAGDTRFDRVRTVAAQKKDIPLAAAFKAGQPLLVIGSSWAQDMAVVTPFLNAFAGPLKVIIAPHELHEDEMAGLERDLHRKTIRYSRATEATAAAHDVLLIDNIGMLSSLYAYGDFAYVGGGFGKGIHNILEAATFGLPVFFGPRHGKFQEAVDLVRLGGAFGISSPEELQAAFTPLYTDEGRYRHAARTARQYVQDHTGATETILDGVEKLGGWKVIGQ